MYTNSVRCMLTRSLRSHKSNTVADKTIDVTNYWYWGG